MAVISRDRMLLALGLLCLAGPALAQDPLPPVYMLPTTVTPLNYLLRLDPDFNNSLVNGAVVIELTTSTYEEGPVTCITLHLGVDLILNETSVLLLDLTTGTKTDFGSIQYDNANTLVKVVLPDGASLVLGHMYALTLPFTALLYNYPRGLFIGSYDSPTSKYVASNLRPTYARDVFPCFDEPQYKVPVRLQVKRPATHKVFSTAPLFSSTDADNDQMVIDTFESTGPISIHSLGLFITDVANVTSMGVSVFAPTGLPSSVPYLDTLLSKIQQTLGPFPITPLNLVVLPDQLLTTFASYGFVFTSPEIYLGQVVSKLKWLSLRLQLTETILRQYLEFSRTPQWWSELWLSESVGAYLATTVQPDAQMFYKDWLRIMVRSDALGRDFLTAPPVVPDGQLSKWDIEDLITSQVVKNRGLSVLTMWEDTMPEGLVSKTIYDFVKLNQSTVSSSDLLNLMVTNIQANTTYDVSPTIPLLASWLFNADTPVVTYSPQNDTSFTLTQSSETAVNSSDTSPVWPVSVSWAQNGSGPWDQYRGGQWLLNSTASFTTGSTLNPWVIFNLESAPYRVDYQKQWGQLIQALQTDLKPSNSNAVPDSVRAAIQDDAVALALAGKVPLSTALAVLANTPRARMDWFPVTKAFDAIAAKIGTDQYAYSAFQIYAASLFPPETLQWLDPRNSSVSPPQVLVRAIVTPSLCQLDLGSCRQAVRELNQLLLQGNTSTIDPELLDSVACYGSRYNNSVLDSLMTALVSSSNSSLRHLYVTGVSCLTEPASVQSALFTIINDSSPFTTPEARKVLVGLSSSLDNSAAVTDFIVSQASAIQSTFGSGVISEVIKSLGKFRVDLSKLQLLTNDSTIEPSVVQSAVQAQTATLASSAWWSARGPDLVAALPAPAHTTTLAPKTAPTVKPVPGPTNPPVTTTRPSGAVSLMDGRVLALVAAAALTVITLTNGF